MTIESIALFFCGSIALLIAQSLAQRIEAFLQSRKEQREVFQFLLRLSDDVKLVLAYFCSQNKQTLLFVEAGLPIQFLLDTKILTTAGHVSATAAFLTIEPKVWGAVSKWAKTDPDFPALAKEAMAIWGSSPIYRYYHPRKNQAT